MKPVLTLILMITALFAFAAFSLPAKPTKAIYQSDSVVMSPVATAEPFSAIALIMSCLVVAAAVSWTGSRLASRSDKQHAQTRNGVNTTESKTFEVGWRGLQNT